MSRPMPMLLDAEDRKMLMRRVVARLKRERPDMHFTRDELRDAVRAEAEALVVEGGFVFQDGAFIRWPPLVEFEIRDFELPEGAA
jgi:hypothetical protein